MATSTKPPGGTRDFLPDDIRRREHVIGVVRGVYERYGFEPLETPAFENIETLLGKYGEEGNKLIFKILRRGEHEASGDADLALRYDLTVPLARVVAQYQSELPKFFKRYQIQPVWRADRPAKGRFREFFQCDIDSIGSTSPLVEVEQLSAVSEILTTLGFGDFTIQLNHRALLRAMLEAAGIPARLHGEALVAIDKLDKIGRDGVIKELMTRGIEPAAAEMCLAAVAGAAAFDKTVSGHESAKGPRAEVEQILALAATTAAAGHVSFVPRLARGLSYYTGAIMEISVPDLAGSLGGGGRYDNLVGMFLGRDVPACGFSLGLERIIVVMTERGMFPAHVVASHADVMVTMWNDGSRPDSLALAGELRRGGLRVDVYPEADKLGKQFKYASSRNVPFVTIVGDDERAAGTVSVKDMRSGSQLNMPRDEVAPFIRIKVSAGSPATSGTPGTSSTSGTSDT
jgi:histidyl-tRNA synthetase